MKKSVISNKYESRLIAYKLVGWMKSIHLWKMRIFGTTRFLKYVYRVSVGS